MNAPDPRPSVSVQDETDDPRVVQAAQEYLAALESGRRPNRIEFLSRHPDIAEPLAECLGAIEFVHSVGPRLDENRNEEPPVLPMNDPAVPLGDFRLLREIGRGGMGVVYEAEQLSLGRRIALKVLPFALTLDPRQLQRFKNEARAAAQLHHTNIVPIYAVGCERGVHFYAMQYIEGRSLAGLVRELRKSRGPSLSPAPRGGDGGETVPVSTEAAFDAEASLLASLTARRAASGEASGPATLFRATAQLGLQAAEALEHAHQLGVVHRDIKPANLLLDVGGHLWVTDFGLAQFQSDAGLTVTGDVVGTLRYMSPEQALAKRGLVDHRSDIYSLGATLYELLALEPAFDGRDREELLRQITYDEPRPLRKPARGIPADLETIVLKAMAKEPESRYATAQDLADDLRRFLDDKPILARRPTLLEQAAKWSRRHRSFVAAGLIVLLTAALGLGISTAVIVREQLKTQAAYDRLTEEQERTRSAFEAEVVQRNRAEKLFRQAREAVDFLAQLSEEELAAKPELHAVRRRMLETALAYYQDFIEQRRDDSELKDELAGSYMRVAAILDEMGDRKDALAAVERARTIQEDLLRRHPQASEYQRGLWSIYNHLGWLRDANPFYLLSQKSVQKELKLSEAQVNVIAELSDKWREAFRDHWTLGPDKWRSRVDGLSAKEKGLVEELQPEQLTRLQQIALQERGIDALADSNIAETLGLTAAQKEKVRRMQNDARRDLRGRPGFGGARPELWKKPEAPAGRNDERLLALLDDVQKTRWKEMTGEPFRGSIRPGYPNPPGFGMRGGPGSQGGDWRPPRGGR